MRWSGSKSRLFTAAVLATACGCFAGCGDVGDSSVPQQPQGSDATGDDAGIDDDASAEGGNGQDSTVATEPDSSHDATLPQEENAPEGEDSGPVAETGPTEVPETGAETGPGADSGGVEGEAGPDASVTPDAGESTEASAGEAGADATTLDASSHDAEAETGAHEAGTDGGHDAGAEHEAGSGPLVPCTTAGQTGCVLCDGNSNNLCTATEAEFVQQDITAGLADGAGKPPLDTSCYECLVASNCLDSTAMSVTGKECEDSITTGTESECLSLLSCVLGADCASSQVDTCYCGTAPATGTCDNGAPNGAANGACASQVAAASGFPVDDGTDNLTDLVNPAYASGRVLKIFKCALNNTCSTCQP